MPTTSKGLRYPAPSASPNIPNDLANLATDVNNLLPGGWAILAQGNATYGPAAAATGFATLPQMTGSVTVPSGRTLTVEFKTPRVNVPTGGEVNLRLIINGSIVDSQTFITATGGTSGAWPCAMSGHYVGTGAAVTVLVDFNGAVAGGFVQGNGHIGPRLQYQFGA